VSVTLVMMWPKSSANGGIVIASFCIFRLLCCIALSKLLLLSCVLAEVGVMS